MKVAIYSPYLDTLGGGERYVGTIAEVLIAKSSIDMLLDNHLFSLGGEYLKKNLQERFGLKLSGVNFIKAPLGKGSDFFSRLTFLRKYDLLFYLTDGSIFIPWAKRNILHIQSPLVGQPAKNLWGKLKLKKWDLIIYNSEFTKKQSEKNWPIDSRVIYPPVGVDKIKPLKKKKYILSVGRFFGYLKDKKHELLIEAFKKLYEDKKAIGWSLHLVGSASDGDKPYINELKNLAKGFSVNFYPNLAYDELSRLYGQSSIYWHASGFGENDPTKMEHFGISTVEAMAGGCVPVVLGKGGQMEIVENGLSGFLWNSVEELVRFTQRLIIDKQEFNKVSKNAISRSQIFSKKVFESSMLKFLY